MGTDENQVREVWVFTGPRNKFPSAVFSRRELAEVWIEKHRLNGTLTAYPLDVSVYDWAVDRGYFTPDEDEKGKPNFIGDFSSASQEHYHYDAEEEPIGG